MSSRTKLIQYEAILCNSLLKAIFALTARLGRDSLFHRWPLSPGVCLVVLRQSFAEPRYVTAMPSSPGNHTDTTQALTLCLSNLKLNYHMYFLSRRKDPIANPSQLWKWPCTWQQATDLLPQDPSETSGYQETAIKSLSSTQMARDKATERSTYLSLSCTSYSYNLKTSPVRRNFTTALI